jgi:hypothetical protein
MLAMSESDHGPDVLAIGAREFSVRSISMRNSEK